MTDLLVKNVAHDAIRNVTETLVRVRNMELMVKAVLFDFSGTLFRLEEDESWFEGMTVDEQEVDGHVQAELMRRLTAPTGRSVQMSDEQYHAWVNRDLAPHLHREAYLHVLRESGLADPHAESLYARVIDPDSWTAYPDTAAVLKLLKQQGIKTAVVSNIAFDIRPAFTAIGAHDDVDEFVLSFEVGAVKPDAAIFTTALERLGVTATDALMVGDSEEADGGARAVGCAFALVDPLPTVERPDGLMAAVSTVGITI
jgi:HAD superfamily hydrolase (TIGR01509 family)